jgi:hypothetical protein
MDPQGAHTRRRGTCMVIKGSSQGQKGMNKSNGSIYGIVKGAYGCLRGAHR